MGRTAVIPEQDLCRDISDAALSRFLDYGYNKTTMAEIAHDVGMSAANLYRYFDNKQDIAAACCTQSMNERLERLRFVCRHNGSFQEVLTNYALTMIEHTHEIAAPDSRIGELFDNVTREKPDLIQEKLKIHYQLLADLLTRYIARDDIMCEDISGTARYIYSALVFFDAPLFVGLYERSEFEHRARGLVTLIVRGLTP